MNLPQSRNSKRIDITLEYIVEIKQGQYFE